MVEPEIVVPEIAPVDTRDPTEAVDEADRGPMTVRLALIVLDAVEMTPASDPMPVPVMTSAVTSDEPMEMFPKPEPKAPEVNVPTVVRDETVTPAPNVDAFKTWSPLIVNTPPDARLIAFPPVIERPPAKLDVAEESDVRGPAMIKLEDADSGPWTLRLELIVDEAEMIMPSVVVSGVR